MKFSIIQAALAASLACAGAAVAAPPLEAYGKLPGFEMTAMSPSGDRYAVVGAVGEARQMVVLQTGGRPLLTAPVGDQKVRDIEWAGEDKVLMFGSETYALGPQFALTQYEIGHAYVIDLASGDATPLFTRGAAGNGVWGRYGITEENGRWYGYFGAITLARTKGPELFFESGHPDLYKVDLEKGSPSLVARRPDGDDATRSWLVGPDGGVIATFDRDRRTGAWRLRADKRGETIASGVTPLGGARIVGQGRTPGTVVYNLPDEDEQDHWIEAPLAGGEGVEILEGEEIARPLHDIRTGLLIGYVRDADMPEPVFFDAGRQAKIAATRKAFPGLNMTLAAWNEAFDRLIVKTDGNGDSGTWWMVDLKTGKAEDIGRSYPQIRSADVGPVKMVAYKAADGLAMEGVLTLPPGREAKDLPLVVFPHGGPEARDYPHFDWWAQAFASRGYAVFQPNFRGSSGYGQAFIEAGERQWGRKMQTDISDGVAELARQGIVDPKRACIMGASYGGYAALAGVTLQQGLYRCAVSVAGVSDLPGLYRYDMDATGRSSTFKRNWEDDIGSGPELKAISPADNAVAADAPVMLVHGKDDTVVPFDQSKAMERALRRNGKGVELVVLKGEDHYLSREETRLAMLKAAVGFVERHNPPGK